MNTEASISLRLFALLKLNVVEALRGKALGYSILSGILFHIIWQRC